MIVLAAKIFFRRSKVANNAFAGDPQWSNGQHRRLGIGRSAVQIPPRQKIFLLCQVPTIFALTLRSKSILGRWKAKEDGKQRKHQSETRLESWISKAVSSILAGSHRSCLNPSIQKYTGEMESLRKGEGISMWRHLTCTIVSIV